MRLPAVRRSATTQGCLLAVLLLALAASPLAPATPAHASTGFTVDTTADTPDANPGDGDCADNTGACSLRAAVEETNALPGWNGVQVPSNTYIIDAPLVIEDDLNLDGGGKNATIIDGNHTSQLMLIRTVELLVCDASNNAIASYNRHGKRNPDFLPPNAGGIDGPMAVASNYLGDIFVTASSGIHRFEPDGTPGSLVLDPAAAGLGDFTPTDGVIGSTPHAPDSQLYVADYYPNSDVLRVNPSTGAVSTLVGAGDGGLQQPNSLAFFEDDLYVTSATTGEVLRYDGTTGDFVEVFTAGLTVPRDLAFRGDTLYIANEGTDSVRRHDAETGVYLGDFVAPGAGGLDEPTNLAFGPGDDLYVLSGGTHAILRYDGETGAFLGEFVGEDEQVENPTCLEWRDSWGSSGPRVTMMHLGLRNGASQEIATSAGLVVDAGSRVWMVGAAVRDTNSRALGGGIRNYGKLSLLGVEVAGNTVLEGDGGQMSQGGGIWNTGQLWIWHSLIAGNFAGRGGGISNVNQGTIEINTSTISGNHASGAGGGIRNVDDGVIKIGASTIANNRANSPLSGGVTEYDPYGGGIYNHTTSTVVMANTILAGNTDNRSRYEELYSPDCYSATSGNFDSYGDNLIGILTDNCVFFDPDSGGIGLDLVGTPEAPLDPGLLPLADNGGQTYTHKLQSASPAVDRDLHVVGEEFFDCYKTDQREKARPQGRVCDIGAFELIQGIDDPTTGGFELIDQPPANPEEAGLRGTLITRRPDTSAFSAAFASVADNPTSAPIKSVSRRFFKLELLGAEAGDRLAATFYYPAAVGERDERDPGFQLLYFTGSEWRPVRGSGGAAPTRDSADNADGSVSGGRFQVTFDETSSPTIAELRQATFTATDVRR